MRRLTRLHRLTLVLALTLFFQSTFAFLPLSFTFELGDPSHLEHVISSVKNVDSVFDAYRVVPSAARG